MSTSTRHFHVPIQPEDACAQLARGQRGLTSRAQAVGAGLSKDAIQRRVMSGRWERVLPGVYRVGGAPSDWNQLLLAATIWAGPGALTSHRSAAALHGFDGFDPVMVEITVDRYLKSPAPWVVVHRTAAHRGKAQRGSRECP